MTTFSIGDSVKIKSGVQHADIDTLDIGGWQGRVHEITDDAIGIILDSITLSQLSDEYIIEAEEEGLGWREYFESPSNFKHAKPRDTKAQSDAVYDDLMHQFRWAHLDEEGRDINAVVGDADDFSMEALHRWEAYLSKHLTFPFKAEVSEWSSHGGHVRIGDRVRVLALSEADDHVGVLVKVKRRFSTFELPLCDLTVLDESAPQHDPVQLYSVWFANR